MADFTTVVEQLRQKRKEVQQQVHKLDKAVSVLKKLTGISINGIRATGMRPRRRMSAAARRRIAQAQKARWAAWRKQAKPSARIVASKRTISAAGRRRIAAAQRARWAKIRQQEKKAA